MIPSCILRKVRLTFFCFLVNVTLISETLKPHNSRNKSTKFNEIGENFNDFLFALIF